MKDKSSLLVAALCFALILPASALSQSPNTRPRRVAPVEQPAAQRVAYEAHSSNPVRAADSRAATAAESATLESFVPREGLRFYFEMRSGGMMELARAGSAMKPVTKMLAAGPAKVTTEDLAAFVISNTAALSGAKLALVGYGASGTAALIEAATPADAEQLRAGVATLFAKGRASAKASGSNDIDVSLQGRMVVAGARATVARLVKSDGAFAIAEDQAFMKARERFSSDPFFAYVEIGSQALPPGFGTGNAAYDSGVLSGLGMRPYALAMGGSLQGDATTVRALLMFSGAQGAGSMFGMFGSVTSAAQMGQPVASNFASPDADIFVDFMLDWDKLYDSIQSVFEMVASAQANGGHQSSAAQSADMFAMAEASLGFSIKNDLIPTLGNEVAVSLSGFDSFMERFAPQPGIQKAAVARRPGVPRFMLMVALKNPAKFEKLIAPLFNKSGSQPLARATYRNATISYNKDIAYALTNNFFMISGSVMDIRRAMDARTLGNSLATSADFRAAVGAPRQTMLQAYLSSNISSKLYEAILTEATKSNPALKEFGPKIAQAHSPVGLTIMPDSDGVMVEMRVPTNLTFMALASLAGGNSAPDGVTYSQPDGLGIPNPTGPSTRTRTADGRRVPKLTDDDLRSRRP